MHPLFAEEINVRASKPVGRNEPCTCGSGKKYKRCCLTIVEDRSHLGLLVAKIREVLIPFKLDQILIAIRKYDRDDFRKFPFLHASISEFALRFCQPGNWEATPPLQDNDMKMIIGVVSEYAYTDPIGFDAEEQRQFREAPYPIALVRLTAKQTEINFTPHQLFGEAIQLFQKIPAYLQETCPSRCKFDLLSAFESELGVTPVVYMQFSFIAWRLAEKFPALQYSSFLNDIKHLDTLADEECLALLDNHLCMDKGRFLQTYETLRSKSSSTTNSSISPLFIYPFIQPWSAKTSDPQYFERVTCPVPSLIAFKASIGIYYQLLSKYHEDFLKTFGYIFEEYVGRLLRSAFNPDKVIHETDIHEFFGSVSGKRPDFIVIEEEIAFVIECKAIRYTKELLTDASLESMQNILGKLLEAFTQIHEFISTHPPASCTRFSIERYIPVVITYGRMHLLTAPALRGMVDDMLVENGIEIDKWHLMNVHDLELLEPHLAAGIKLRDVLNSSRTKTFSEMITTIAERSGKTFGDSFLFKETEELMSKLVREESTNATKQRSE